MRERKRERNEERKREREREKEREGESPTLLLYHSRYVVGFFKIIHTVNSYLSHI